MTEIIRVLRVLEYVGERGKIEGDLAIRGVKGNKQFKHYRISESLLGETSEILTPEEVNLITNPTAKNYILDQITAQIDDLIDVCSGGVSVEESEVLLAAIEKGRCISPDTTLEELTNIFKALTLAVVLSPKRK